MSEPVRGASPAPMSASDRRLGRAPQREAPPNYDTHEELPQARLFRANELAHSHCQPLNDPVWTDAYGHLRDDDPVLGLYLDRRARALPWWIMKNHHVANLVFDDLPVLVTLCEMCSGASAFRAEVDGRRLAFRLRGQYNATILLEDTSTDSLWSPFTGVALAGAMRGAALERLPLSQCLWSEWLAMHPTTEVLYGEQALREGHGSEFSPGSPGIAPGISRVACSGPSTSDSRTTRSSSASRTERRPGLSAGDIGADRPGPERLARRRGDCCEMPARDVAGARLPPSGRGPRPGLRLLRNAAGCTTNKRGRCGTRWARRSPAPSPERSSCTSNPGLKSGMRFAAYHPDAEIFEAT